MGDIPVEFIYFTLFLFFLVMSLDMQVINLFIVFIFKAVCLPFLKDTADGVHLNFRAETVQ